MLPPNSSVFSRAGRTHAAFSTELAAPAASHPAPFSRPQFILRVLAATFALGILYLTSARLAEAAPVAPLVNEAGAPSPSERFSQVLRQAKNSPPPPPFAAPGLPPPPPYLGALHQLALSDAQDDRIFLLLHKQMPVLREQQRAARQTVEALRQLAASDQYDPAQARALIARHAQAISTALQQQADTDAAVRAVLTPAQRQQLDRLLAAHAAEHRHPPLASAPPAGQPAPL